MRVRAAPPHLKIYRVPPPRGSSTVNDGHLDFQMHMYRGGGRRGLQLLGEGARTKPPPPPSSFDTHPRWQPERQSARSRRSYGKIEDCEQSIIAATFDAQSNSALITDNRLMWTSRPLLRTVCFVPGNKRPCILSKFNPLNTDTPLIYQTFLCPPQCPYSTSFDRIKMSNSA